MYISMCYKAVRNVQRDPVDSTAFPTVNGSTGIAVQSYSPGLPPRRRLLLALRRRGAVALLLRFIPRRQHLRARLKALRRLPARGVVGPAFPERVVLYPASPVKTQLYTDACTAASFMSTGTI